MFVSHVDEIPSLPVESESVKNVLKQVLVGPEQGWEGYVMRLFTVKGQGNSPRHAHPWPHINYIVAGEGILYLDGKEHTLKAGGVAFIPPDREHQFINRTDGDFSFICIVPEEGDK